jgi:hypothetical protein
MQPQDTNPAPRIYYPEVLALYRQVGAEARRHNPEFLGETIRALCDYIAATSKPAIIPPGVLVAFPSQASPALDRAAAVSE